MNHEHTQIHKTHHNLDLKEPTIFSLIIFFVINHRGYIQMSFYFEILEIKIHGILKSHNFFCKPSINVKFKTKF
jgi:hypothetical protein